MARGGALGAWARRMRREVAALALAMRHPATPWQARLVLAAAVAYALSPIDLIPDFIPVLGYLDDLVIVPAGIALAVRLVPAEVLDDCRRRVDGVPAPGGSRAGAALVVLLWLLSLGLVAWLWLGTAA